MCSRSCSAYADEQEIVKTEAFTVLTNSVKAEVCGIALALDMAIQDYTSQEELSDDSEKLYVLTD